MNEEILDLFKELMYKLAMDNQGHLRKVIGEVEHAQWLYEEAIRVREGKE